MRFLLDYHEEFRDSLFFWLTKFIRYKLTTLSNANVIDKDQLALLIDQLQKAQNAKADIKTLESICKKARSIGLIGIATYANPLLRLFDYLTHLNYKSISEIDEEVLIDFLSIQGSGLSPASKKNYRIALIGFFGYIDKQNEDKDHKSYTFNIELKNIGGIRGKSGQKLPAHMNEAEIEIFLKAINDYRHSPDKSAKNRIDISLRDRLAIKIIIYTGVRVSEILNLKLKDIFPEKDVYMLHIRGKGNKMRTAMIKRIHIQSLLEQWLKERKKIIQTTEFLFCNQKGSPMTQAYLYKVIDQILSENGIHKEKMGAHMLRHSFATLLYQKKKDLILVQEALGHSDLNTSRIYMHFDKDRLIEAANLMDDFELNKNQS